MNKKEHEERENLHFKYNPNHDARGRFAHGGGGAGAGQPATRTMARRVDGDLQKLKESMSDVPFNTPISAYDFQGREHYGKYRGINNGYLLMTGGITGETYGHHRDISHVVIHAGRLP